MSPVTDGVHPSPSAGASGQRAASRGAPIEVRQPARVTAGVPVPDAVRWWRVLAVGVALIVAAHLLDHTVWQRVRDLRVNDRDWGRMLRTMGYLPFWIVLGAAMGVRGRRLGQSAWMGWMLVAAPTVSGIVAEAVKLCVRRLRPDPEQFGYVFRAFSDGPWSNRGMGMPSSHVMVAVAAAAVLARCFPESRWLWWLLAAGCALTRILSLGHFLSDTVTAAVLGLMVAWALLARWPAPVAGAPPLAGTGPDAPASAR